MNRIVCVFVLLANTAWATEPVTYENFTRAESDTMLKVLIGQTGGVVGELIKNRMPIALDKQDVIRMNRDTLYSGMIIDLSAPVSLTLPDVDGRYQSAHIVNQDHYSFVIIEPGVHELTQEIVGTRYALISVRTFVDPTSAEDVASAHQAQDGLKVVGGGKGALDVPDWDQEHLLTIRQSLNNIAKLGGDTTAAFGMREEVDELQHFIMTAAGWGGLPRQNALYEIRTVAQNDGSPYRLTVADVPVKAFWSITVYNSEGYISENSLGAYSFNNITASSNEDGSTTINFGHCDDGRVNCLPVAEGWNYIARMYEPDTAILDGSWIFPDPEPIGE